MSASQETGRVHFVGISGAGMLPLSICMKEAGWEVSGEDDSYSSDAVNLLKLNQIEQIALADQPDSLAGLKVVRSSAISSSHPSLVTANQRGYPILRRGECLFELCRGKKVIAIAGSHGKTSTCAIVIDLLEARGEPPSFALGGLYVDGRSPGRWNESEWMVIELDESDGTIESFEPEVTVILNVDYDHHSFYESEEDYRDAFRRLRDRTKTAVVVGKGSEGVIQPHDIGPRLEYPENDTFEASESNQLGAFSKSNQSIAHCALRAAGFDTVVEEYMNFSQIKRRQNFLYFSPLLKVIEDYAHHPTEIEAFCEGLKVASPAKNVVVFQPHRYSRTRFLKEDLSKSLQGFDRVILLDVYAASESPVEGGTGEDLFQACRSLFDHCAYIRSERDLFDSLKSASQGSEPLNVIFLGAGRTDDFGREFVEELKRMDRRWGAIFSGIARYASVNSKLRADEPMKTKTTLRVGGRAEMYFEPSSEQELLAVLNLCSDEGIPVYSLGRGSNLIVPEKGVSGLVIRLSHSIWKRFRRLSENEIRVGAGLRIKELCGIACREGLEGFEFLEGIPGSVGGALRMNAGAMGGWMFDVVKSVRFATLEGKVIEANAEELTVGYRHCRELETAIALDAVLKPKAIGQSETALRKAIDVYQMKRKESQPREPSAGCIFKNPEGDSAGRLIEELGLKGTVIGGAEISEAHGNFIINRGGATSDDVIELVKLARRVARSRRSIELEPEALLYGGNWQEALR